MQSNTRAEQGLCPAISQNMLRQVTQSLTELEKIYKSLLQVCQGDSNRSQLIPLFGDEVKTVNYAVDCTQSKRNIHNVKFDMMPGNYIALAPSEPSRSQRQSPDRAQLRSTVNIQLEVSYNSLQLIKELQESLLRIQDLMESTPLLYDNIAYLESQGRELAKENKILRQALRSLLEEMTTDKIAHKESIDLINALLNNLQEQLRARQGQNGDLENQCTAAEQDLENVIAAKAVLEKKLENKDTLVKELQEVLQKKDTHILLGVSISLFCGLVELIPVGFFASGKMDYGTAAFIGCVIASIILPLLVIISIVVGVIYCFVSKNKINGLLKEIANDDGLPDPGLNSFVVFRHDQCNTTSNFEQEEKERELENPPSDIKYRDLIPYLSPMNM